MGEGGFRLLNETLRAEESLLSYLICSLQSSSVPVPVVGVRIGAGNAQIIARDKCETVRRNRCHRTVNAIYCVRVEEQVKEEEGSKYSMIFMVRS